MMIKINIKKNDIKKLKKKIKDINIKKIIKKSCKNIVRIFIVLLVTLQYFYKIFIESLVKINHVFTISEILEKY